MAGATSRITIELFLKNVRGFTKGLRETTKEFKQHETQTGRLKKGYGLARTAGKRLGLTIRHATLGFRGFRMEMLGVMFFGMAMQRFFFGLLKPAAQSAGIFELISTILSVVFLPIILALLPHILKLGVWLMGLSNPIKLAIGAFVLIMGVLGAFLMFIGVLILGIGGVIGMIALGWVPVLIAILVPIIMIVIAAIVGFVVWIIALRKEGKSWKEVFIRIWTAVKEKVWPIIKKLVSFIKTFVLEWRVWLMDKLIGIIKGWYKKVLLWIAEKLPPKLTEAWEKIKAKAIEKWEAIVAKIKEIWGEFVAWIKSKMPAPLLKVGGYIKEKVSGSKQTGGFIPHTGLYRLHAGETVTPAGGDTFTSSPTINVYGATTEELVRQISEAVTRDLSALARR